MFTIIIPTYNHEDTIKYAISSVLKQTHQNFEIFVVGDGA
ncbi:MAG: glycosyltransferase family A protein, partial [Gilvibacter sp.]